MSQTEHALFDSSPSATVAWSREWTGSRRSHRQCLVALASATAGHIGVRITVMVDGVNHDTESYASAEVFDGTQWHAIAGLPPQLMKSAVRSPFQQRSWIIDAEGIEADMTVLLRDVRWAYELRAPGPGVQVSREPPTEPDYVGLRDDS